MKTTPENSAPIRWAIAGLGVGGRTFHAPLVEAAADLQLAAIVGSSRYDGPPKVNNVPVVTAWEDLLELGVTGITITTPAGTHEELAHRALDLGLHVVVDKPFALSATAAKEIIAHAHERSLHLSVYQNRRWDGDFLTLRALMDAGTIGAPIRFYNRIQRFYPDLPMWNTQANAESGGGTLVDLGPHLIDQAVQLLGYAVSVTAELTRSGAVDPVLAENDVLLLIEHISGARSVIEASVAAATQGPRFQLNGIVGGIEIDGFDVQEEALFAGHTPQSQSSMWGVEPQTRMAVVRTKDEVTHVPLLAGAWTTYYPMFAAAIRGAGPVPVNPLDAVHTAAIIDAARISASERATIDI